MLEHLRHGPDGDPAERKYARLASAYDRRWAEYVEATTSETLKKLRLSPGDRLLDVACGTGALLRKVAADHPSNLLTGVDICGEMLTEAERKVGETATLIQGAAHRLPLPEGAFDVVACCNSFHYFAQPLRCLQEMRRVLRPGGRLVITDWCADYVTCRLLGWVEGIFSDAHEKVYRADELADLLEVAGFAKVTRDRYRISWSWGLVTVIAERGGAAALRRAAGNPGGSTGGN